MTEVHARGAGAPLEPFPPLTLRAAAGLVVAETAAELLVVAWRDQLTIALRVALMAAIALQLLFARLALRRSAGAVFGLLLSQLTAVLVAVGSGGPVWARSTLAVVAVTIAGLLLASAHAFPSPELRARR